MTRAGELVYRNDARPDHRIRATRRRTEQRRQQRASPDACPTPERTLRGAGRAHRGIRVSVRFGPAKGVPSVVAS